MLNSFAQGAKRSSNPFDSTTTAGSVEARKASRPQPASIRQLNKFFSGDVQQETRTPEAYDRAVEGYLRAVRAKLADHMRYEAVTHGVGRLRLAVKNNREDNFEEVAVVLSFGGGISAYFDEAEARSELDADLPARPRPWGPYRRRPKDFSSLVGQQSMMFPRYPAPRPYR
jgi:hypothetical protein